ncbi:MAG: hypothetical protein K2X98_05060 [Alphaproteobacteria bacterium]|nr:hypothetical protein [Alphaproteobacteria bacterium]
MIKFFLILLTFLTLTEAPVKAAGYNETEVYNLLNQLLADQNNSMSNQNTYNQPATIMTTMILAAQVIPPLWTKVIKPLGGTFIDFVTSTTKKCRACCGELRQSSIDKFIEDDLDITEGSQKTLLSFFNTMDQTITKNPGNPLYKKVELESEGGFVYTLPNLQIKLNRALDNQRYTQFDVEKEVLKPKTIDKFFALLNPHLKPYMSETAYTNFCEDLKYMKANALLQIYDIHDDDPTRKDAIGIEIGIIIPKASIHDDDSDVEAQDHEIPAVFSSRYRIVMTAYDIPEDKAPVQTLRKRKTARVDYGSVDESEL